MPPLPSAPNTVAIVLEHAVGQDVHVQSKLHFTYAAASLTTAQMNSLCTAVAGFWATNVKALLSSGWNLYHVYATDLNSASGAVGIANPSTPGTRAGNILTAETCTLINFKVARRYRGGHPRVYLPYGVATDLNDAQTWQGSYQTAVNTAWSAFITAITGYTGPPAISSWVNVSYYSGGTWVGSPPGPYHFKPTLRGTPLIEPIVTSNCNTRPGSQRRRMLR